MREESLLRELRALYEGAGFRSYKTRKFEEYSLYLENRDFLGSESAIAFGDVSGRLLALKPDVTISIVKGARATRESGEKLYYVENVYRLDDRAREYKEIRQVGLESLGEIDDMQTLEVVSLALESLVMIDPMAVMDISHMGYLRACLNSLSAPVKRQVLAALRTKSKTALDAALAGCEAACANRLKRLMTLGEDFRECLRALSELADSAELSDCAREMEVLYASLRALGLEKRVRLDFSIANDLSYYTGIVFQGYARASHRAVLSGGRYDGLAEKFGKDVGALGFAIYLSDIAFSADAAASLLLYNKGQDPAQVALKARALRREGKRVRVETRAPEGASFAEVQEVENA